MSAGNSNSKNNAQSGDMASWIAVIACFAFGLWPIGLILLIRKISFKPKDTKGAFTNAPSQKPSDRGQAASSYQSPASAHNTTAQTQQNTRPPQAQQRTAGTSPVHQPVRTAGAPSRREAYRSSPAESASPPAHRQSQTDKTKSPANGLAIVLTVLSILLAIVGVIFLSSGLSALAVAGTTVASFAMAIFGGFSLLGAAMTAIMRSTLLRRLRRYSKYAAVIGGREVVSVNEIAQAAGEPLRKTRKRLEDMLSSGYYGDAAYIDDGLGSFVLSRQAADKARASSGSTPSQEDVKADGCNPYVAAVNELHMLCSQTSDPVICTKIERIEALTVKIFRIVEEKPEKTPQLRALHELLSADHAQAPAFLSNPGAAGHRG